MNRRNLIIVASLTIIVSILVASVLLIRPFSIDIAIDNSEELKPDNPIGIKITGYGLKTSARLKKDGKRIPGQLKNGFFYPDKSLKHDSSYSISIKASNWIGKTLTASEDLQTWSTPKFKKLLILTSVEREIEATSTISEAITSDSTMTFFFSRKIKKAKVEIDGKRTTDFKIKNKKVVLDLLNLGHGTSHTVSIKKVTDFQGHPLLVNVDMNLIILSEPSPAFSVSEGQSLMRNQVITVSFDKNMNTGSVQIEAPFESVNTWNSEGTILTITPTSQNYDRAYFLNFRARASGIDGSFITADRVINFKTAAKQTVSPEEHVRKFFDAFVVKDYKAAYELQPDVNKAKQTFDEFRTQRGGFPISEYTVFPITEQYGQQVVSVQYDLGQYGVWVSTWTFSKDGSSWVADEFTVSMKQ